MLVYIIRRLGWAVLLLVIVSALTFLIFYVLPTADPAVLRAGRNPDPDLIKVLNDQYGLDEPWYVQFGIYMRDLLHFDFQRSYQNNVEVREEIFSRMPATISLALGGAVVWLLVGIPIGILSAVKRGTIVERLAMGAALIAISAPVYWLGLVSIYLFSTDIGQVLPIFDATGNYADPWTDFGQWLSSLVLPWLVLATAFAAIYARFMRSNLVDVLDEDYIRTARAKGLTERRVVLRHGVRSAVTPIVTIFGLDVGILFGGAILTETVFNIPGIGRTAFAAIEKGDVPIVQGTVLIGAMAIILFNLIVDIVYAFLDPRVRY